MCGVEVFFSDVFFFVLFFFFSFYLHFLWVMKDGWMEDVMD